MQGYDWKKKMPKQVPRKQLSGKGAAGKAARKKYVKKTRENVKPYKDRWSQINYAYFSRELPIPESYL